MAKMDLTNVEAAKVWGKSIEMIMQTMSPISFQTWFKDTQGTYEEDIFVIVCQTDFGKEWLYSRYSNVIVKAVVQATGNDKVKIGIRSLKLPAEAVDHSRVILLD